MHSARERPHRGRSVLTRLLTAVTVLAATLTLSAPAAHAASIEEVGYFGSNPGNLRMFHYVPDDLPPGSPLVVALHGCTQNATGYGVNSGWVGLAERHGFALLLPQQRPINNGNRCFNWFRAADTARGWGEAASIESMRRYMVDHIGVNPGRVYVTGLSAGGAMTAVVLATYPGRYAGGGVVAGIPYRCASYLYQAFGCMNPGENHSPDYWGDAVRGANSHDGPWPTVSVWHGAADTTVAPANQRELVEQWTNVTGTDAVPERTGTAGGYPHAVYRDSSGRAVVQTYTITGMGHGQPVDPGSGCGHAAAYMLDVGFCAAREMARGWGLVS